MSSPVIDGIGETKIIKKICQSSLRQRTREDAANQSWLCTEGTGQGFITNNCYQVAFLQIIVMKLD